jgi:alpha-L-fucosidase
MSISRRRFIQQGTVAAAGLAFASLTPDGIVAETAPLESQLKDADGPFQPTAESLASYRCPEWFRDAKLGFWAVWGAESVPMHGDWYARQMYIEGNPDYEDHLKRWGHPSRFGYKDIIPLWKAEKWEPDGLMALYKKAGAKYFCMIAMHHDNFDCWSSRFQRWNAVNMGPRRDIAGEWQQAARRHGLHFGMTEHLAASWWFYSVAKGADKDGPLAGVPYDGADPRYADLYWSGNEHPDGSYYLPNAPDFVKRIWFNRIHDMIDRYHPDLLYSDSPLPYPADYGRRLLAHYYNDNYHRHGGKIQAVYTCKQDSTGMWVQDLERGIMGGIAALPWQTDTCVGGWYYDTGLLDQHLYKSAEAVLQMLADIVSKNGNLLLNFPLRPDGMLDADELKFLDALASWMPINGEAIFGTRPWQVFGEGPSRVHGGSFNEGRLHYDCRDIRFTTKGHTLYALALGWPADGTLVVRSLASSAGKIERVSLLGHKGKLAWKQTNEGLEVNMPPTRPCDHVFVLKIAGAHLKAAPGPIEATIITAGAAGQIVLRAVDAEIHGNSPQYEDGDGKDQVGYWGTPEDFVSWRFKVAAPGSFAVQVTYSCDTGAEGSEFTVEVGEQKLVGTSKATGSWATYTTESLGKLMFNTPGAFMLSVKPKTDRTPWKVMGLKSVELIPAAEE